MRFKQAYIGLGSNLGQPLQQLKQARDAIAALPETRFIADSGYFSSTPMGPQDQPDYLNAVALIETGLSAADLLLYLQSIENRQGRVRNRHWGARTVDLDILLYGDERIDLPQLQVPHPGICERDFVYLPLLKINREITIPGLGELETIVDNLMALDTSGNVTQYAASYQGLLE